MNGDHGRSAELLANLFKAMPGQTEFARKALGEALDSGHFDLALALTRQIPAASLPSEARLLVIADEFKRRRLASAAAWMAPAADGSDLSFLKPIASAWDAADRNDLNGSLQAIAAIPASSPLAAFKDEQDAFLLLKFGKTAQAEPFARRAIGSGGIRETRIRLALASGFVASGDAARAEAMLDGISSDAALVRDRLFGRKRGNLAVDNGAKAFSEVMTAIAGSMVRRQGSAPPLGLAQVALYANPDNSSAALLLALFLDIRGRSNEALKLLASMPADDPLISQVRDSRVRILSDEKRFDEAFAIALAATSSAGASATDFARLGDLYGATKRSGQAAGAYRRAIALRLASGESRDLWTLYLLEASSLEEADRWPESKQALMQGLKLMPEQPLLLNFLGYAKLERGEDLDAAEAMVRRASELAPDDASIIDSLGWAQYKRGKTSEAIETLQKAAEKDPDQAEIREHLGDALFASGRRYEARFAWKAALITAEDDVAGRIEAKVKSGLTPATAAP